MAHGGAHDDGRESSAPRTPTGAALAEGTAGRVRHRKNFEETLVALTERDVSRVERRLRRAPLLANLRPLNVELEREQSEETTLPRTDGRRHVVARRRPGEARQELGEEIFAERIEARLRREEVERIGRQHRVLLRIRTEALGEAPCVEATGERIDRKPGRRRRAHR